MTTGGGLEGRHVPCHVNPPPGPLLTRLQGRLPRGEKAGTGMGLGTPGAGLGGGRSSQEMQSG